MKEKLITIQAWTLFFKHEEETLIVPVGILLPGLLWHYYKKPFLTPLLESFGEVLYLDTSSIKRFRVGIGQVQIQIDLTKPRPRQVRLGLEPENYTI